MLIIGYSRAAAAAPAPAAGPELVQLVASGDDMRDNSASLTLPAGVRAGNTLIVAFKIGNFALRTVTAAPSGWTLVGSDEADKGFFVYAKTADGSEGGTTVSWSMSGSGYAAFVVAEVSGERTVEAAFSSASFDPPAHAPSGGSLPTLWIAASGGRRGDNEVTAGPDGYSGLTVAANDPDPSSNNVRIAGAWRTATAASEDPGPFAWAGPSNGPQAVTISAR